MNIRLSAPGLAAAGLLSAALALPALAHHGWTWTADGMFQVEGVIKEIYLGNPHATLDVEGEGEIWRIELAPPRQTERAGFNEASAKVGDEVTAIGNRSLDPNETRMKAVRIIIGDKTYDVYPDRAKQI